MSSSKAVVVLAPNGRRQTVKVSPDTTILQILEEVCKKQGLKPEEFDIRHHNKALDTTTPFRFSGLPNNAQLELAEAATIRADGIVTLLLQLEDGTRLQNSFSPNTTLWDVLVEVCPNETRSDHLAVIYTRQEIYGKDTLSKTTLRNLGLTNGRALLRVIHRKPEELRTQANVAVPLPSKPVVEQPYIRKLKPTDSPVPQQVTEIHHSKTTPIDVRNEGNQLLQQIKQESERSKQSESNKPAERTTKVKIVEIKTEEKTLAQEEFVFLGKRNAMVFSQATAQTVPNIDLPDDFFDLTVNDAKKLLRDLKKHRLELEQAPLQTSTLRSLEKSKHELSRLNRYKSTVLRVYFPDQTVLQGTFKSIDTVSIVIEFVREFLEHQNMVFYLYTTPPKQILDNDSRLLEVDCVPNAVLHFGTDTVNKDEQYLKHDLISKFTTPSIASLAAAKIRNEATRQNSHIQEDDDDDESSINEGASTSQDPKYEDYPPRVKPSNEREPVPKWFKLN